MTPRGARRLLWLGALLLLPMPVLIFGPGRVPAAQLLELGAIGIAIAIVETARGNVLQIASVLLAQFAAWAACLWLATWLVALPLASLGPRGLRRATLGLFVAGLVVACALPIYRNPFAARVLHATLLDVYR